MTATDSDLPVESPLQAFLSYAHADETELRFVDPLVRKLQMFVRLKSGRDLVVFVDRDGIGWGEDWRARLLRSIEAAALFVPVVTATYLRSPVCREEFLTFLAKADALGVTDLLLPVTPFDSRVFRPDSSDAIARFVATHQHRDLEPAMFAGYDSPDWMRATASLATALLTAWEAAEQQLAGSSLDGHGHGDGGGTPAGDTARDDVLLAELHDRIAGMTVTAGALAVTIQELARRVRSLGRPDGDPAALVRWADDAARALRGPAAELADQGTQLYAEVKGGDLCLRLLARAAPRSGAGNDATVTRRRALEVAGDVFRGVRGVGALTTDLVTALAEAEAGSAQLRQSLRPARAGLTAVRDAIALLRTWELTDDLRRGDPRPALLGDET